MDELKTPGVPSWLHWGFACVFSRHLLSVEMFGHLDNHWGFGWNDISLDTSYWLLSTLDTH